MEKQALIDLTAKITEALNNIPARSKQWEFTPDSEGWSGQSITSTTSNAKLYISYLQSRGTHLHISGSLHVGENGQYVTVYDKGADGTGWHRQYAPDITVAVKRGAEVIAKEIHRRMLPEYMRILRLANDSVDKDRAYKHAKENNLARLARTAGVKIREDRGPKDGFYTSAGNIDGSVRTSADDADIDLRNLTINQAEKVLAFIKTL